MCENCTRNCEKCVSNGDCTMQGMDGKPIFDEVKECVAARIKELFPEKSDAETAPKLDAIVNVCLELGISSVWERDTKELCWNKPQAMDNAIVSVLAG